MVLLSMILVVVTCFLAYSNGANDNFKGVATLFGSNTVNYEHAIWWATITTFVGSLTSIFLAELLVKSFSGKGLVPDNIAGSTEFLTAVGFGAALTVFIATKVGFPISTTHGLIGALVGAGFMAVGDQVNLTVLGDKFVLPLLLSPAIALGLSVLIYWLSRKIRINLGIEKELCLCIGEREIEVAGNSIASIGSIDLRKIQSFPKISLSDTENCVEKYKGTYLGIKLQSIIDYSHFLSSGVVCFARGLNDTPKIVAMLAIFSSFKIEYSMIAVAIGIGLGGLVSAKKVAITMSKKIVPISPSQGFVANLVTGGLVVIASKYGMPVSTTHVSVGSIFGIGMFSDQSNNRLIGEIVLSWVLTLPLAAIFSAITYKIVILFK